MQNAPMTTAGRPPADTLHFGSTGLRYVMQNGEPWFVASDVCESLTIQGVSKAVGRLRDEEKSTAIIQTHGGEQRMLVISEAALHSLIVSCRKPAAAKAKKTLLGLVKNSMEVLKALAEIEVPDDLPDMHVYAIRNTVTGAVKLGISRDPAIRLKQLQTGNDCRLELVATRPALNRYSDESELHRKHAPLRLRGEWFACGAEI